MSSRRCLLYAALTVTVGESALLRNLLNAFDENDVVVFDRYYCSYRMLAMLLLRGVHLCARLHRQTSRPKREGPCRPSDFHQGQRLGLTIT